MPPCTPQGLEVGGYVKSGGCVGARRAVRPCQGHSRIGWSLGQGPDSLKRIPIPFTIYEGRGSHTLLETTRHILTTT